MIVFTDSSGKRPCDGCRECCRILGVAEIGKPQGAPCPNECAAGCAVQATKPASCRDFDCAWSLGILADVEGWRPDRLGVMFWAQVHPEFGPIVVIEECREGAFQDQKVRYVLTQASKQGLRFVFRSAGRIVGFQGPRDFMAAVWAKVNRLQNDRLWFPREGPFAAT